MSLVEDLQRICEKKGRGDRKKGRTGGEEYARAARGCNLSSCGASFRAFARSTLTFK
jgi:hypothetical protein